MISILLLLLLDVSSALSQKGAKVLNLIPLTNGETFGQSNGTSAANPLIDHRYFEGDISGPSYLINSLEDSNLPINDTIGLRPRQVTLWSKGIIPFQISPILSTSAQNAILKAIDAFHAAKTCLRFVTKQPTHQDYILFTNRANGCYSAIGKLYGEQEISLGKAECQSAGVVMHLIMHSIGFWHEQSRSDRDAHVTIMWNEIDSKDYHNFRKYDGVDDARKLPYDHLSIMHFGQYAFVHTGKKTVVSISAKWKEDGRLGQRVGFSPMDVIRIRQKYCNLKQDESNEDVALLKSLRMVLNSAATDSGSTNDLQKAGNKQPSTSLSLEAKLQEYMENTDSINLPDGNALKGAGHNIDTINIKIIQKPRIKLQETERRKSLLVRDGIMSVTGRYRDDTVAPAALSATIQHLDLRLLLTTVSEERVRYSCTVLRLTAGVVSGGSNPLPDWKLAVAEKYLTGRLRIGLCTWFRNMLRGGISLYEQ